MVTLRNKPRTLETPVNPKQTTHHEHTQSTQSEPASAPASDYEQCRDKRIRENMERMQKLGLFDLSSKLKSQMLSPKRSPKRSYERRTPPQSSPFDSSSPARRSSRLKNAGPVCYSELPEKIKGVRRERVWKDIDHMRPLVDNRSRTEIYTEEHEKQLGSCEGTWTLFVDGCGPDGRRVYDQVKGKSCHQCRQKTLGHRTHCNRCEQIRGQFCGDCLYMRYGEHVLEANQNPDWICPVCRGICNCSLCRAAKGWPPTGSLYRKVVSLGFKSVAHYLIQTRRAETKSGDANDDPVLVKRSLPFAGAEEVTEDKNHLNPDNAKQGSPKHSVMDKKPHELEGEKEEVSNGKEDKLEAEKERLTNEIGIDIVVVGEKEEASKEDKLEVEKEGQMSELGIDLDASATKAETESIASRLRPRSNKGKAHGEEDKQEVKKVGQMNELGTDMVASATKAETESISSRLRKRDNKAKAHSDIKTPRAEAKGDRDIEDSVAVITSLTVEAKLSPNFGEVVREVSNVASGSGGKRKRKSVLANEPNPDSISGRLRQRRNKA